MFNEVTILAQTIYPPSLHLEGKKKKKKERKQTGKHINERSPQKVDGRFKTRFS